jgi:hypothetical protein
MSNFKMKCAAVLVALLESQGTPESLLYIAIGCNLDDWYILKATLLRTMMIDEPTPNWIVLTPKGIELARKIHLIWQATQPQPEEEGAA